MSNLREAAQQALEALERIIRTGDSQYFHLFEARKVIPDLRAALEEPDRKPLTDEEIRRIKPVSPDLVDFRSGVRCAERAHGIGSE